MITKHSASLTLVVHPQGHLDALKTDHYRSQIKPLLDGGYRYLIIDLEDVSFINSSGLGLLVELYNRSLNMNGSLRLINCQPQIMRLLQQTKLDKILFHEALPPDQPLPRYDPLHSLMNEEILLLTRVNEISSQIVRLDEAAVICDVILEGVIKALGATRGTMFLVKDSRLALGSWRGLPGEPAPAFDPLSSNVLSADPDSLMHQILAAPEAGWFQVEGGGSATTAADSILQRLGFCSVLASPIRGNRGLLGLMLVEMDANTSPVANVARPVIQTLANLCGMALEKAALYQTQRAAATDKTQ